jgi:hypothetical protein
VRRAALVLAFAILAAVAASGCMPVTSAEMKPVTVVVTGRGMPPEFEKAFVVGDAMRVADSGVEIGAISSVEATPTPVRFLTAGGATVERPSPLTRDYRITLVGSAKASGETWLFPRGQLALGKELLLTTKLITFTGTVLSVQPGGQ